MRKLKIKVIEVCEDCGELPEDCFCDEIDDECGCDCDACREVAELTDEEEEELRLIEEYLTDILQVAGCPQHTFEILLELAYTFKEVGFQDARDLMASVLDDME